MKSLLLSLLILLGFTEYALSQSCVGTAGQVTWNYWLNFTSKPDTNMLVAMEDFPSHPTGQQVLHSLTTTPNFTDNFASYIRGYIHVTTTDDYIFNLTGDDQCYFYLSSNELPANKQKKAWINTWTYQNEYYKEANQTSQVIHLEAGRYYYFEIYHFEGNSGDFVSLAWRKSSATPVVWSVIDANYINDYTCGQSCPVRGTPCNDGNASTTNDLQDGFCNCVGTYPTNNACVGDRGVLDAYYYDNLTGGYVENDLQNAPKFPLSPDRREKLKGAYGPLSPSTKDNYGTLVQGYLTVPVSGTYEFLITGDNQTFFFMSKNDSIEYKQYHQAIIFNGIAENDYTNSIFQKLSPLYLEKGKYYYFEFRHKESTWRDYFNLFWKTPFHEVKAWKKVPNFYLFDYKCELACIAQGTPCDDGNRYTNNDQINATCDCVGTPCSGLDCDDEVARYQAYKAAAPTTSLTPNFAESSWLSCTTATNPNTARAGYTKWIKYDFGAQYKFQGSRVWNYNVAGLTNRGFKIVAVDYSTNGTTWTSLGTSYSWPQASGAVDYAGFAGPNFNNIKARYILISAIQDWGGGSCTGFSKITFDASLCEPEGTACDDGDPLTKLDKFDANCNCAGVKINCATDTLNLGKLAITDSLFQAKRLINSQNPVALNHNVSFVAGNSIVLLPGFDTGSNVFFNAKISACLTAAFLENQASKIVKDDLENSQLKKIIFSLNAPAQVKLVLKNDSQQNLVTLIDSYYETIGTQTKLLPTNKLPKGTYWVELTVDKNVLTEKFTL